MLPVSELAPPPPRPTPQPPFPTPRTSTAVQLALFVTALTWYVAAQVIANRAARGLAGRFNLDATQVLLQTAFTLFLVLLGFSLLQRVAGGARSLPKLLGLPRRPTSRKEWLTGVAIGWGIVVLAVLPMALAGALRVRMWSEPRAFWLVPLNLATIAVGTLVVEVVFRGYAFRRLIEALGPAWATVGMALIFAAARALNPQMTGSGLLVTVILGVLLCVGWLRTHGLWIGWGFSFAWSAVTGVLFGLPISGFTGFSTVIDTRAYGSQTLTGGGYGPEAALFTALALLAGLVILVRATREYEWDYTHAPLVAAGYALDVPPPAAHTAMEQQSKPASLVQILSSTPPSQTIPNQTIPNETIPQAPETEKQEFGA